MRVRVILRLSLSYDESSEDCEIHKTNQTSVFSNLKIGLVRGWTPFVTKESGRDSRPRKRKRSDAKR